MSSEINGAYTFETYLTLEGGSEEEARRELNRRLDRLEKAEFITDFEVDRTVETVISG